MIVKKRYLLPLILMFSLSMALVSMLVQAQTQPKPVTYSVAPWYEHAWASMFGFHDVNVDVMINSPTGAGIVTVTVSLRWDPSVLTLGFYYPWAPTVLVEATEGTFLSDWTTAYPWSYGTSFYPGAVDQGNGTARLFTISINKWVDLPPNTGADGTGKIITFTFTPLTGYPPTGYSPLDLIDVDVKFFTQYDEYRPDIVEDGDYGTPPAKYTMSLTTPPLPTGDPSGTQWHELYPVYSNEWELTSWTDNWDGDLSVSDQIEMEQLVGPEPGWIYMFHVDAITITIHWTYKDPLVGDEGAAEPGNLAAEIPEDPIGTYWHQIYGNASEGGDPTGFCRIFNITSWTDNGGLGFDPSDQFDFYYLDDPGTTYWAHLDAVTIDIILSFKEKGPPMPEFPLGVGLMIAIAPVIAIAYLWRSRKKVVAK